MTINLVHPQNTYGGIIRGATIPSTGLPSGFFTQPVIPIILLF